jgi:hypothetical protein
MAELASLRMKIMLSQRAKLLIYAGLILKFLGMNAVSSHVVDYALRKLTRYVVI